MDFGRSTGEPGVLRFEHRPSLLPVNARQIGHASRVAKHAQAST